MKTSGLTLPLPDADETGPYALVGTARAKLGFADELERRLLALVEPTRREAGALAYHVHRDRAEPDAFVFYEVWRDVAALRAHLKRPYVERFLSRREDVLAGDLDVRWLRMSSPYVTR